MNGECETTIRGGLPITVAYVMEAPQPDVGFDAPWVDDFDIVCVGRNDGRWLMDQLTADEIRQIEAACLEDFETWRCP